MDRSANGMVPKATAKPLKAYSLLKNPMRWVHGHWAVDFDGQSVAAGDNLACRWDGVGAIQKSYPNYQDQHFWWKRFLDAVKARYGHAYVIRLDHAETLEVLLEIGA